MNPVTDLEFAFPQSRMQARPAEQSGFLEVENAIHEILPEVKHAAKAFEAFELDLDGLRFAVRPGHPRAQMIYAFGHRVRQHLHIRRVIAPHDEPSGLDAIGWVGKCRGAHFFLVARRFERWFLANPPSSEVSSFSSLDRPLRYSLMNSERRRRNAIGATALRSSIVTSLRASAAA